MTHVHNTLIRGLNAIIQQAPYVKTSSDSSYNQKDVRDLLTYATCWVKMVEHHHWVEESFVFPEIEKFSGRPGFMDDPKHQHELFHDGMQKLLAYAQSTKPESYHWDGPGGMKEIVDSFSQDLMDHLYAEVELLLAMKDLDSAGLKKVIDESEAVAMKQGSPFGMLVSCSVVPCLDEGGHNGDPTADSTQYDVFPCVLGNADKTYKGGEKFPPLPGVLPYLMKYWFAAGNGAWRFNSCDFWGRPRPLAFGPPEQQS